MSKLYFLRHAQASFMADNYDQLSDKGIKQSAALGHHLAQSKIVFDKVYVGPLQRQKHTAQIVKSEYEKMDMNLPSLIEIEGLREHMGTEAMHIGFPKMSVLEPRVETWLSEAKQNPSLKRRNNLLAFQLFMDYYVTGKIELEGVETWQFFRSSVKAALDQILAETGTGETIGIFTSGGTISSITAESLDIKDETKVAALNFSIRNTSINTFLYSKDRFNVLSLNEIPHLDKEMVTFV